MVRVGRVLEVKSGVGFILFSPCYVQVILSHCTSTQKAKAGGTISGAEEAVPETESGGVQKSIDRC